MAATISEQRAAMLKFFEGTTPAYAECGCCGAFHPVPYLGDCRNDLFRIHEPDALHGSDGWSAVDTRGLVSVAKIKRK